MACSCHKKEAKSAFSTKPDDQCVFCARKHIKNAWTAWGEFCYEDLNRDYCSGQLRAAADHMKFDHYDLAIRCRDLAVMIEEVGDTSILAVKTQLDRILEDVRNLVYKEHPDIPRRLFDLGCEMDGKADLIIPLGNGSRSNNDELRILLRSAEKNLQNLGRVIVVSTFAPSWLRNALVLPVEDTLKENKDGNLIQKVVDAVKAFDVKRFVLAADDNVFCQPVDALRIPILYLNQPKKHYEESDGRWAKRMVNTYNYWESRGIELKYNYEVHCPQTFRSSEFMDEISNVPYREGIGLSLYTCLRLCGPVRSGSNVANWKNCFEKKQDDYVIDKVFCGYNDESFLNGLREKLFKMFDKKSKYEG